MKDTFEQLRLNSQKHSNIKPVNLALGSETCEKMIRIRDNSELNTLVDSSNQALTSSEQTETVCLTTLDQFCKEHQVSRINLLKMDVQGYELELLKGADDYLSQHLIDFVYSEVGFDKTSDECQQFDALNDCLVSYGFRLSGFYEVFRWGANKRYFGFCNALFVNCHL
ncbi:FkbM family methyltransferase [Kovacikia minuta CCNUW1]|uniref:FkbM family methyltransferase n=1 Tax=Kovacikia minuta TaxID=2931930 RepID=UPI001CCCB6F0|nr:FkbM family methyltransferase [Kovacikia minuta]UBF29563.1 FkbM family methyltransferase [Kovacikia minuta CCNUW1]